MSNRGKKVQIRYIGTLDDGTVFDARSSEDEPLAFICMSGMVIAGLDKAVENMKVGEIYDIRISPEDAYGPFRDDLIEKIPYGDFPNAENLPIGRTIYIRDDADVFPARVVGIENGTITFDRNHPLAGQYLNFKVELLKVSELQMHPPAPEDK